MHAHLSSMLSVQWSNALSTVVRKIFIGGLTVQYLRPGRFVHWAIWKREIVYYHNVTYGVY